MRIFVNRESAIYEKQSRVICIIKGICDDIASDGIIEHVNSVVRLFVSAKNALPINLGGYIRRDP